MIRARSGSILHPPIGPPGSAGWRRGDPIPRTVILCELGLLELPEFPSEFSFVEELDLSYNGLSALPSLEHLTNLRCLFLGGIVEGQPQLQNSLSSGLPTLLPLQNLEHLSVHDTLLPSLPELPPSLRVLRVDRCPLLSLPPHLPALTTLHLEGCPLPGALDRPDLLPYAVKRLHGSLEDLQLPDGGHMGFFFGSPVPAPHPDEQETLAQS